MKIIASATIDGSTMYYNLKKIEEYMRARFVHSDVKINLINTTINSGRMELIIKEDINEVAAFEEFRKYASHAIKTTQS